MSVKITKDGTLKSTPFLVCEQGMEKFQASIASPSKPTPKLVELMSPCSH